MRTKIFTSVLNLMIICLVAESALQPLYGQAFSGGSGTVVSPYLISTKADFYQLAIDSSFWNAHFKQTADIIFDSTDFQVNGLYYNNGQGFPSIGGSDGYFSGDYNGDLFMLSGLEMNRQEDTVGIFRHVKGGVIRNLRIEDICISGLKETGGLIGVSRDVSVLLNISVDSLSIVTGEGENTGGIIGLSEDAVIDNVSFAGHVEGEKYVGGLIGKSLDEQITNCRVTGTITGTNCAAGMIGRADYLTMYNCYGIVHVNGDTSAAGLVGYGFFCEIYKCFANGSVTCTGDDCGGLLGLSLFGNISNCYSITAVSGGVIGGFAGKMWGGNYLNCYAAGPVNSIGNTGGFSPFSNYSTVTSCFWDVQTTNQDSSLVATGLSTAQLKTPSTYLGWNFSQLNGLWEMQDSSTGWKSYPYLQIFQYSPPDSDTGLIPIPGLENLCSMPMSGGLIGDYQQICAGSVPAALSNISLPSGHQGELSYTWQFSSTDSISGFTDLPNSNSPDYQPPAQHYPGWFRRLARVTCADSTVSSVSSSVAQIELLPTFSAGSITQGSDTVCSGTVPNPIIALTAAGGGDGEISYLWLQSVNPSFDTADTLSVDTLGDYYFSDALTGNFWYKRMAKDGSCSDDWENSAGIFELVLLPSFSAGSIQNGTETICHASVPSDILSLDPANGNANQYAWLLSTDTLGQQTDTLSSLSNPDFSFTTPLEESLWVQRLAKDSVCQEEWQLSEGVWQIMVRDSMAAGAIGEGNDLVCDKSHAISVSESNSASGGSGIFQYFWEISTDSFFLQHHIIPGASDTILSLQPQNDTENRWWIRRGVIDLGCDSLVRYSKNFRHVFMDTLAPIAVCADIEVVLDSSGKVSVSPFQVGVNSTDNCDDLTLMLNDSSFSCEQLGVNMVTLIASDRLGNSDSCLAEIRVVDNSSPLDSCPEVFNLALEWEGSTLEAEIFGQNQGSYCDDAQLYYAFSPDFIQKEVHLDCSDVIHGNLLKTLYLKDNKGNAKDCAVEIALLAPPLGEDCTCKDDSIFLSGIIGGGNFKAGEIIIASGVLNIGDTLLAKAGSKITLKPGFSVPHGSRFLSKIDECQYSTPEKNNLHTFSENELLLSDNTETSTNSIQNFKSDALSNMSSLDTQALMPKIQVFPNPFHHSFTLAIDMKSEEWISVNLQSLTNGALLPLLTKHKVGAGLHQFVFHRSGLPGGLYLLRVQSASFSETHKISCF